MENRQLVLFYKNSFDVDNLGNLLLNKFPYLGPVLVMPNNNENLPIIMFQKKEIKIVITDNAIDFKYPSTIDFKLVLDIIESLENQGFSFDRMGYISFYLFNKKEKEKYMENNFKKVLSNGEFQFSIYKREYIDSVKVNVVELSRTIDENDNDLSLVFDINTPINEIYYITSSFLNDFLKECDKYIKSEIKENIE